VRTPASVIAVSLLLAACGGGSDGTSGSAGTTSTTRESAPASTTTAEPVSLEILVTNDDGYAADGIDVLVEALRGLPGVTITVVAPETNQSGTGSKVTPGTLTATVDKTKSGYPATAVDGFPADAVAYGLSRVLTEKPDLVVSGINQGQNLGPIAAISGTVGAAKAAATAGIPALAVSQGIAAEPDYATAASLVVEWVTAQRDALLAGTAAADIVNLNVPTCPVGSVQGVRQVPLAAEAGGYDVPSDCTSTAHGLITDVTAFAAGFATATELDQSGEQVTTSTTWPAAS